MDSDKFESKEIKSWSYLFTMQEHQMIPTNATVSKDSDTISISVRMAVYEIHIYLQKIILSPTWLCTF